MVLSNVVWFRFVNTSAIGSRFVAAFSWLLWHLALAFGFRGCSWPSCFVAVFILSHLISYHTIMSCLHSSYHLSWYCTMPDTGCDPILVCALECPPLLDHHFSHAPCQHCSQQSYTLRPPPPTPSPYQYQETLTSKPPKCKDTIWSEAKKTNLSFPESLIFQEFLGASNLSLGASRRQRFAQAASQFGAKCFTSARDAVVRDWGMLMISPRLCSTLLIDVDCKTGNVHGSNQIRLHGWNKHETAAENVTQKDEVNHVFGTIETFPSQYSWKSTKTWVSQQCRCWLVRET